MRRAVKFKKKLKKFFSSCCDVIMTQLGGSIEIFRKFDPEKFFSNW